MYFSICFPAKQKNKISYIMEYRIQNKTNLVPVDMSHMLQTKPEMH